MTPDPVDEKGMAGDGVVRALQAALATAPDDVAVRRLLVERLVAAGRTDEAVALADELLVRRPDDPDALDLAIDIYRAVGDDSTAAALTIARAATGPTVEANTPDPPAPHASVADRPLEPGSVSETTPGGSLAEVPDTADELIERFERSAPVEEVEFGRLAPAGVALADVGGLAAVKEQLERSFLGPLRNAELAAAFGKAPGGGLLLWGPPGCGKTFLARAVAGEMGANFYSVGLADVLDMWVGSSERNLAAVFDAARRHSPCVLFFDELDALGQKRSHLRHAASLRGVVNQLLAELDGVTVVNDGLFVLGATNHPWDVDEALLRPGRFDRRILVLPPDEPARRAILAYHLRGRPTRELDLAALVASTAGYSGADLAFVVETAAERCLAASMRSGRVEPLDTAALTRARAEVAPTIGPWLETARNHVLYANRSGEYDELERYLREHDRRSRPR